MIFISQHVRTQTEGQNYNNVFLNDIGEQQLYTTPRRPYFPHPLALCCHYPVSKCRSASIVVTSTVRVNDEADKSNKYTIDAITPYYFITGNNIPFDYRSHQTGWNGTAMSLVVNSKCSRIVQCKCVVIN